VSDRSVHEVASNFLGRGAPTGGIGAERQCLLPADVKLLNTVIVRVNDVQIPTAIEGQAVWSEKLTRFSPLVLTKAAQVPAVAGELLNPTTSSTDPQTVMAVAADADGPMHARNRFELAPQAATPILKVAKRREIDAVRSEFLHAAVHGLRRIDVALLVERDEIGASRTRFDVGLATEFAGFRPCLPHAARKRP